MSFLSSLHGRIFLASALLAVLSSGVALYLVNARVNREAEGVLRREVEATGDLVDQLRNTRTRTFLSTARLMADIPQIKAAVDTNDPPTVEAIAIRYQEQIGTALGAGLLLVTNESGDALARVGSSPASAVTMAADPAVRRALAGGESVSLWPEVHGILQLVTVPILLGLGSPEVLGSLSLGFLLDDELAIQLKTATQSEIVFALDGRVLASTLPEAERAEAASLLAGDAVSQTVLGGTDFVVSRRPLSGAEEAGDQEATVLILRSRTEQLRFLNALQASLVATAGVAVALAVVLSFAVARTITRPLAALAGVMREMAQTGDLARPIALPRGRWDDEEARVLTQAFDSLTMSIERFQEERSHRERLASLGSMSTIIAHEIRNPLMIIKAALHGLRRGDDPDEVAGDIDGEVTRLNRLVNEVLDFARPIRFELEPMDLNALCTQSAQVAEAASPGPPVRLELDPVIPPLRSDPERLRLALLNLLQNGRHAAAGAGVDPASEGGRDIAPVTLATARQENSAIVTVSDRGVGIAAADLPRIFDPYFTTKRGGTGLGLAITKKIVEGLGGTIAVSSEAGRGTEVRCVFPLS
ncbi:MAG: HAMP domain-containing protein [Acidimicrobiia bacterium]|nr:HAMP domain-containing protein [Acidimicrobiia bacterium]